MTRTRTVARPPLGAACGLWLALVPAAQAQSRADTAAAATPSGTPAVVAPVKKPAGPSRSGSARPAATARAARTREAPSGASEHLSRAGELYQNGRFDEVVPELQAAYHLNPLPRILCNIAQAYRKGGHPREAAEQYDLCLRTDPELTPEERADFDQYRQQALAELAAATAASEPPHPEPAVPAPPPAVAVVARPPPAPPRAAARPLYKRAWFWGVLGSVVAAGAVTAGVLVWQLGKPDPLSLLPPETPLLKY